MNLHLLFHGLLILGGVGGVIMLALGLGWALGGWLRRFLDRVLP